MVVKKRGTNSIASRSQQAKRLCRVWAVPDPCVRPNPTGHSQKPREQSQTRDQIAVRCGPSRYQLRRSRLSDAKMALAMGAGEHDHDVRVNAGDARARAMSSFRIDRPNPI
jgi:hypothetical protein